MPRKTFSQKRALILREILDKYHFDSGVAITGNRYFIDHRPERLVKLHNGFGYLAAIAYVPPEQETDYMRELKQVHKALKTEYKKMKRRNKNGIKGYSRIFRI